MAAKKSGKKKSKKAPKKAQKAPEPLMSDSTQRGLLVIVLFAIGALIFLSLIGAAGTLGEWIASFTGWIFGWVRYALPAFFIGFGYTFLHPERYTVARLNYIGLTLLLLSMTGLFHLFIPLDEIGNAASFGRGGGYLGIVLSYPLLRFTGIWVTIVLLVAGIIGGWLLLMNLTFSRMREQLQWLPELKRPFYWLVDLVQERRAVTEDEEEMEEDEDIEMVEEEDEEPAPSFSTKTVDTKEVAKKQTKDPEQLAFVPKKTRRKKSTDLPIKLLSSNSDKATSGNIDENKEKIHRTLESFNIDVEMGEVSVGPMVTQYTMRPAEGVKLNQITTLQNDLALALAAHPIRIEAPIPGKSLVGIEIPNESSATVTLKELLAAKAFKSRKDNLAMCLGKDVSGAPVYKSVAKMPHMLIAGATGSGKSVCINGIITSLLFQNSADDLRFIMVDPKRVELTVYNGIPHLLTPVITEVEKTINALKWAVAEMDRRYERLAKVGKRNLESYNDSVAEQDRLPYIVFVIDELADLMSVAASSVEAAIVRLAQMSRAVGIHLILATQRPSVNVITGLIKANMPARIAFSVTSLVDSRTILDFSGAEKLIGKGDMLYVDSETSTPKRIQGAFLSDEEIESVVEYLRDDEGGPQYNHDIVETAAQVSGIPGIDGGSSDSDELVPQAKEVVVAAGKASASLLQRRLRVGYARAARILDILEEEGFIGPADGSRPREVLATEEAVEESIAMDAPSDSLGTGENEETDGEQERGF
jgi:S-DNA-T family DNA segregation ATPase FtsK/SpoIIIE